MQLTVNETTEVQRVMLNVRRQRYAFLSYADWFNGWEDPTLQEAMLRRSIVNAQITGSNIPQALYTAWAKIRFELPSDRIFLVAGSAIGRAGIAGSVQRITRIYSERYGGSYMGAWRLKKANEMTVVMLCNDYYVGPKRVLTDFLDSVRTQTDKVMTGTCACGVRKSHTSCAVCGADGGTNA